MYSKRISIYLNISTAMSKYLSSDNLIINDNSENTVIIGWFNTISKRYKKDDLNIKTNTEIQKVI